MDSATTADDSTDTLTSSNIETTAVISVNFKTESAANSVSSVSFLDGFAGSVFAGVSVINVMAETLTVAGLIYFTALSFFSAAAVVDRVTRFSIVRGSILLLLLQSPGVVMRLILLSGV